MNLFRPGRPVESTTRLRPKMCAAYWSGDSSTTGTIILPVMSPPITTASTP
jgi:hypothetical protein